MLREWFYQQSMGAADPDRLGLAPDSLERWLRTELGKVVSLDDFAGWYSPSMGAPSCGPVTMTGMLLLQMRYRLSDGKLIEGMRRDNGLRYALRFDGPHRQPPSVTKFRNFRARLRIEKGADFLHKRVLKLAVNTGLIPDMELQAQDSSNTDCRGAQLDTFNLISVAIGVLIREVARVIGSTAEALAAKWTMSRYLARSVKGQVDIDWSSEQQRNKLLTEEIADADRLPALVEALELPLPPSIGEALALVQQVARQDVEELDDGTFKIKRGTAKGRIVSVSDPEARHGRKSSSKKILGFKHNVQGTLSSQFVTAIVITDAGKHDAGPSPELLDQSEEVGLKPTEAVGDLAYGTGANIRACAAKGVTMLTKVARSSKKGCLTKREFDIDLNAMAVTCPQGRTTTEYTMVKAGNGSDEKVPSFKFQKDVCGQCPLAQVCNSETRDGKRRTVKLSAYEDELQRMKDFNATPRAKGILRARSAIERLISHLVRMGLRKARFFGMEMVQFQAYLTAAAYNLQRIFTLTASTQA
jgi:hypothetical protein